jgi:ParB family transcriptional regulator, chromosome partitioning protein
VSRPGGLGRGLGALIPSASRGHNGFQLIALEHLVANSRQPRSKFDDESLLDLARSLQTVGLLQPILVRPRSDGRYEIIAGERRYRAARLAGMTEIPAILRRTAEEDVLAEALIENLHRADLNPLEEAAAYQQLLEDFGMTHEALAQKLARSRSAITNALRLLTLPASIQERLLSGALSAGHTRALLMLSDPGQQERLATRIVIEGLSVRATEELVRSVSVGPADGPARLGALASAAKRRAASPYAEVEQRLADVLATAVRIKGTPRRGRVVIEYAGPEDLDRLIGMLDPTAHAPRAGA